MEVLFWTCLNTSTSILTGFVHFFPIFFPQIRTVPRLAYLGAMGVFTAGSAMMGRLRWEVALQSIQNAHGMVENFIHLLRDVTFEKTIFWLSVHLRTILFGCVMLCLTDFLGDYVVRTTIERWCVRPILAKKKWDFNVTWFRWQSTRRGLRHPKTWHSLENLPSGKLT